MRPIADGRIKLAPADELPVRLARLNDEINRLVIQYQPDVVAIESLFHGVNTRSLIVLAHARGVILSSLGANGIVPREITPAEVKNSLTGNGRADKEQVARMVKLLLGLGGERRSADATDALALALCAAQTHRWDRLEESSKDESSRVKRVRATRTR